jgi:hypothetical protein
LDLAAHDEARAGLKLFVLHALVVLLLLFTAEAADVVRRLGQVLHRVQAELCAVLHVVA